MNISPKSLPPTVLRSLDQILQSVDGFYMYLLESDRDIPYQFRTYDVSVIKAVLVR